MAVIFYTSLYVFYCICIDDIDVLIKVKEENAGQFAANRSTCQLNAMIFTSIKQDTVWYIRQTFSSQKSLKENWLHSKVLVIEPVSKARLQAYSYSPCSHRPFRTSKVKSWGSKCYFLFLTTKASSKQFSKWSVKKVEECPLRHHNITQTSIG